MAPSPKDIRPCYTGLPSLGPLLGEGVMTNVVWASISPGYAGRITGPSRARVCTPAGLDIGARTPADIPRSHARPAHCHPAAAAVQSATDSFCGVEVLASDATLHLD